MKFSEMPYERPDLTVAIAQLQSFTERMRSAEDAGTAETVLREADKLMRHIQTLQVLVSIRHSIDTKDSFYADEMNFWDENIPVLQQYLQEWTVSLIGSPYRKDLEKVFGNTFFINAEIELKTFSPEIIPDLQKENELTQSYENLLASAQIPFEGKTLTLAQLGAYKADADDEIRLNAWKADGQWFLDNREELDRLYDELVKLRDGMGKKLGYKNFTELGYYRMTRNCYDRKDIEKFRAAVVKYIVPLADRIFRDQAERLGKEYPMNFADNALSFRSGNPKPVGTADDILSSGRRFYDELSPETGAFFRMMCENELLDVLAKEGKQSGGYCTSVFDYDVPFIFANFNGTRDDVETVTHEAGHAFAGYVNRDRVPVETIWPGMEACEVHSMSMEFFAWPWAELFFGDDTEKFKYAHLSGALTFIPYGTMVDHFQHEMYDHPEYTPAERHAVWKNLMSVYMPWQKIDGEIPVYGDGEGWQRQHHIYSLPFYYIDYCLAQTVALQLWALMQKSMPEAWDKYMKYTKLGGSKVFTELLSEAGLDSPFDETCFRNVCETAGAWLDAFDKEALR